jgi:hypothetical protein
MKSNPWRNKQKEKLTKKLEKLHPDLLTLYLEMNETITKIMPLSYLPLGEFKWAFIEQLLNLTDTTNIPKITKIKIISLYDWEQNDWKPGTEEQCLLIIAENLI